MFLFINFIPCWHPTMNRFKYISCSYLSKRFHLTPYLLLIFKYISCSYLSGCPAMLGCTAMHLNTSHVLIYQIPLLDIALIFLFKYISCSYLSNVFTHFLFSIISYIALFFNISQLFYQPPPHFSFSSSLVSFPLIL